MRIAQYLLVALTLLVTIQASSAQVVPHTDGKVTAVQGDPVLRVTQKANNIYLLEYTPESGVLIGKAMDPQTVLCIEHQELARIDNRMWQLYTVPVGPDSIAGTNVGAAPKQVEVPPVPKLPERTCHTMADWLAKGKL